jgi:hypothetical protein
MESMFAQDLLVSLPTEQAYHALLVCFQEFPLPKFRVVRSAEPSYIEAKFGSLLLYRPFGGAKPFGTAKITITSQDGKSKILIDYDFVKHLVAWFVLYLAMGLSLYYVFKSDILGLAFLLYYFLDMRFNVSRVRQYFQGRVSGYLKAAEQAHRPVT